MGNSDEQFCLKWNDFQDSILSTLQEIRDAEDFVDVTLVCEDGSQLSAHKLILSACSDFFRLLLRRNPAPNPVIVLWDMSVADVRNILKFMYNGEVEVQQANLNTFLSVAERLRVRGLCQSGGKSPNPGGKSPNPASRSSPSSPIPAATSITTTSKEESQTESQKEQSRRRSLGDTSIGGETAQKKLKIRHLSTSEDNIAVKEENPDFDPSPGPSSSRVSKADQVGIMGSSGGGSIHDDVSRSAGGSEADHQDFGFGSEAFDEATGLQSALMAGMAGRGMLDPATAKEIWRRAALARMSLGGASSPPGGLFKTRSPHELSGGLGSPGEQPRRQRSVYSSQQIAQLEAYFQSNEYIDGERKRQLSLATNIPEQQIKVWFQNRRQKKKRELEEQSYNQNRRSLLDPPHALLPRPKD